MTKLPVRCEKVNVATVETTKLIINVDVVPAAEVSHLDALTCHSYRRHPEKSNGNIVASPGSTF